MPTCSWTNIHCKCALLSTFQYLQRVQTLLCCTVCCLLLLHTLLHETHNTHQLCIDSTHMTVQYLSYTDPNWLNIQVIKYRFANPTLFSTFFFFAPTAKLLRTRTPWVPKRSKTNKFDSSIESIRRTCLLNQNKRDRHAFTPLYYCAVSCHAEHVEHRFRQQSREDGIFFQ